MKCPVCSSKAVDVSTVDSNAREYICVGMPCHEWRDGYMPELEEDPIYELDPALPEHLL